MARTQVPIQLIEDDLDLAQSISSLLTSLDHTCTHHKSAEDFFSQTNKNLNSISLTSCVITDVRLHEMSGMELLNKLKSEYKTCVWPVIVITGHGDIKMAVEAMQQGAFGFLTKPFDPYELANKVEQAAQKSEVLKNTFDFLHEYKKLNAQLTEQEKVIMQRLLTNQTSREIAESLGNSTRTVEIHRASIFRKMGVSSLMQLAQLAQKFEIFQQSENPY
jgi:FixJ family two-component response regulator